MTPETTPKRGAKRGNKHAAKPAESHRVLVSVSLSPETLRILTEHAARLGISRGKLIDSLAATL